MTLELGRLKLSFGAGCKQKSTHARRHAGAQRGDLWLDEIHGVKNRHARADRATRGIDVERNVLVGVFAFQEQQLGHHQVGGLIVHRADQENHPLTQQPRVNVISALAATALLNDDGHHAQRLNVQRAHAFSCGGFRLDPSILQNPCQ
jgi:hypothetical protein